MRARRRVLACAAAALPALASARKGLGAGPDETVVGGNWTPVPQFGSPPAARYAATGAVVGGKLWLYGGEGLGGSRADVWLYDGARWEALYARGGGAARTSASAWAAGSDGVTVFGGRAAGGFASDLWHYNVTTRHWAADSLYRFCGKRLRCPWPPGRADAASFAVPLAGGGAALGVHGGRGAAGLLDDVWLWGSNGSGGWTQVQPSNSGVARSGHGAACSGGMLYVVGGYPTGLATLWSLNLSAPVWSSVAVTGETPPGRTSTAYAADAAGRIFMFGGISTAAADLSDLWVLDTVSRTWAMLLSGVTGSGARATVAVDAGVLWVLSGRRSDGYVNGLSRVNVTDLSRPRLISSLEPVDSAQPRAHHSTTVIDGSMIVFGGLSAAGPLRDLWTFTPFGLGEGDVTVPRMSWKEVVPTTAARPEARYSHSAVRITDRMVVFGGRTRSGAMADLWELAWPAASWRQITAGTRRPAARWGHAAAAEASGLVIYGGEGRAGVLSDCWRWRYGSGLWSRVLPSPNATDVPGPLAHASSLTFRGELWVTGGTNGAHAPSRGVWVLRSRDPGAAGEEYQIWSRAGELPNDVSRHAVAVVGEDQRSGCPRLAVVGGESFDEIGIIGTLMAVLTPNSTGRHLCGYSARSLSPSAGDGWFAPRAGHTLDVFGAQLFFFGGFGATPSLGWHAQHTLSEVYTYALSPLCQGADAGDQHCFHCSPGHSPTGNGTCAMCPRGAKADGWGSRGCTPCAAGHFQPMLAADESMCVLCARGTFSTNGARYACETCTPYHECPQGAIRPLPLQAINPLKEARLSAQPDVGGSRMQEYDIGTLEDLRVLVWILAGCTGFLTLAVFAALVYLGNQKECIRFDVFFSSLEGMKVQRLRGKLQRVASTPIGGCFSVVFLILLVAFIFNATILPWMYDTEVIIRLVPRYLAAWEAITLTDSGEVPLIGMRVTLHVFGSAGAPRLCAQAAAGVGVPCVDSVVVASTGVRPANKSARCQWEDAAALEGQRCTVVWECVDCLLPHDDSARLSVTFQDRDVFATHFDWVVETRSGIGTGGYDSRAGGRLSPGDHSALFKGTALTTGARLAVLPVLQRFDEEVTERVAGNLVDVLDQWTGTEVHVGLLQSTSGVQFDFQFAAHSGLQRSVTRYQEPGFFIVYSLACAAGLLVCMRVVFRVTLFLTKPREMRGQEEEEEDADGLPSAGGDPFAIVRQRLRAAQYAALRNKDSWLEDERRMLESYEDDLQQERERNLGPLAASARKLGVASETRGAEWLQCTQWRQRFRERRAAEQHEYLQRAERAQRLTPWGARRTLTSNDPIVNEKGEVDVRLMRVPPERLLFDAFSAQPFARTQLQSLETHRRAATPPPAPTETAAERWMTLRQHLQRQSITHLQLCGGGSVSGSSTPPTEPGLLPHAGSEVDGMFGGREPFGTPSPSSSASRAM
eukprot:TRINITY_DN1435_c2_g1_i1.p1 TRINITY_DN1435_c2_g1~~TRINITY_DN1435_c2_g1_i1.p1  ORF type:complete len:1438 (+),score=391.98 TRINITY_DN1435_c2_g1_i1:35-4348(+)